MMIFAHAIGVSGGWVYASASTVNLAGVAGHRRRQPNLHSTGWRSGTTAGAHPWESPLADRQTALLRGLPSRSGTAWKHWHCGWRERTGISQASGFANYGREEAMTSAQLFADVESLLYELDESQLDDDVGVRSLLCCPFHTSVASLSAASGESLIPMERNARRSSAWQSRRRRWSSSFLALVDRAQLGAT